MGGFLQRLRASWRKDELEGAKEEAQKTDHDREVDAETPDPTIAGTRLEGGAADYERDSEPPSNP